MIDTRKATFRAGGFWGVEVAFREVPGAMDAVAGYAGGTLANPSYQDVCTGRTGHAELVAVSYDPARVSYEELVDICFTHHDRTALNRQGPDHGSQYRSAIFHHDEEQRRIAEAARGRWDRSGRWRGPVVTEITPASTFYRAEDHHQRYLEKHGLANCHLP